MKKLFLTLLMLTSNYVHADMIYTTTGFFSYVGDNDPLELIEVGDLSANNTSNMNIGVGICDPNFPNPYRPVDAPEGEWVLDACPPNNIKFEGVTGVGDYPRDTFKMGTITFFNGDVGSYVELISKLELTISVSVCDDSQFVECSSQPIVKSGTTPLTFSYTNNDVNDIIGSSDAFCLTTELGQGDELCAWVPEFSTVSFDIIAQFGSIILKDITPSSEGGIVTVGQSPKENVKYSTIDGPKPFGIFVVSLMLIFMMRTDRLFKSKMVFQSR